jgi:hypothetical protein
VSVYRRYRRAAGDHQLKPSAAFTAACRELLEAPSPRDLRRR